MLLNLWPNFLQDIMEFREIARAQQPEFNKAAQAVQGLHQEFSLFTMSEYGAGRWEAIMGITPSKGDDLETRRQRILAKYLSQLPYTYRRLLQYLGQTTQGFTVDMDAAAYRLTVDVQMQGYGQQTALQKALTEMIPANLVFTLKTTILQAIDKAKLAPAAAAATEVHHIAEFIIQKD